MYLICDREREGPNHTVLIDCFLKVCLPSLPGSLARAARSIWSKTAKLLDSLLQENMNIPYSTDKVSDQFTCSQAESHTNISQPGGISAEGFVENSALPIKSCCTSLTSANPQKPNNHTYASPRKELQTRTAVLLILSVLLISLGTLTLVYLVFPDVGPADKKYLKFPHDLEDAKALAALLSRYTDQYFLQVFAGFICIYIFLQTFSIPGSILLSIISGFLFPFPLALVSVCFCSATGSSFCYLLSYLVGRKLVRRCLPERVKSWSRKVDRQRTNLLSYIIFLRITPFLPSWFINIVSPIIDVPLGPFWIGSFLGVAPPSFVFIEAGTTLQQVTSTMDPITPGSVSLLVFFALLSLVPVLMKNKLKAMFE